jgi:hypothetical protein
MGCHPSLEEGQILPQEGATGGIGGRLRLGGTGGWVGIVSSQILPQDALGEADSCGLIKGGGRVNTGDSSVHIPWGGRGPLCTNGPTSFPSRKHFAVSETSWPGYERALPLSTNKSRQPVLLENTHFFLRNAAKSFG